MDPSPASMQNLARRLLALEAANGSATVPHGQAAVRVFEKLRMALIRLAGPDGFSALLRRALALARCKSPALERITINPDGSITGLEELVSDPTNGAVEAPVVITTHLLGLLVTFIGEPLTLRLVRDAWPGAVFDD